MDKKYRVLIVDDATFMRRAIRDILETDPEVEVIGDAKNGQECLNMVRDLQPDVITLDMDMPIMDGMTTIRHIMVEKPVPILVLSSLYENGTITFDALRLGAIDFVPKPSGAISQDIQSDAQEIREKVKLVSSVKLENIKRVRMVEHESSPEDAKPSGPPDYVLAVGSSTGGSNTCIRLFSSLPMTLPASAVLVVDMSDKVLPSFARKFDEELPWKIELAANGEKLSRGTCYIHSRSSELKIVHGADGHPCMAIGDRVENPLDSFFSSAAETFSEKCIGIILAGTGSDGTAGFSRIKAENGTTFVQSTETCPFPALAENVIRNSIVDRVVHGGDMAREIVNTVQPLS